MSWFLSTLFLKTPAPFCSFSWCNFMQALQLHLCERHSKHPAGHDFLKLGRQVVGTALSPTSGFLHAFTVMSMYGTVLKCFSLVNRKHCIYRAVKQTNIHKWMTKETLPPLYTISSKIFLLFVVVCFPILWAKASKLISQLINGLQPTVGKTLCFQNNFIVKLVPKLGQGILWNT